MADYSAFGSFAARVEATWIKVWIQYARLREIAHEIICEVFEVVKGPDNFQNLQGAPGLEIQSRYPEDLDANAWASSCPL